MEVRSWGDGYSSAPSPICQPVPFKRPNEGVHPIHEHRSDTRSVWTAARVSRPMGRRLEEPCGGLSAFRIRQRHRVRNDGGSTTGFSHLDEAELRGLEKQSLSDQGFVALDVPTSSPTDGHSIRRGRFLAGNEALRPPTADFQSHATTQEIRPGVPPTVSRFASDRARERPQTRAEPLSPSRAATHPGVHRPNAGLAEELSVHRPVAPTGWVRAGRRLVTNLAGPCR